MYEKFGSSLTFLEANFLNLSKLCEKKKLKRGLNAFKTETKYQDVNGDEYKITTTVVKISKRRKA